MTNMKITVSKFPQEREDDNGLEVHRPDIEAMGRPGSSKSWDGYAVVKLSTKEANWIAASGEVVPHIEIVAIEVMEGSRAGLVRQLMAETFDERMKEGTVLDPALTDDESDEAPSLARAARRRAKHSDVDPFENPDEAPERLGGRDVHRVELPDEGADPDVMAIQSFNASERADEADQAARKAAIVADPELSRFATGMAEERVAATARKHQGIRDTVANVTGPASARTRATSIWSDNAGPAAS